MLDTNQSAKALMQIYKFIHIGKIRLLGDYIFDLNIDLPEALSWERAIYIFVFNDEITRIGSSKGKLWNRFGAWRKDVTNALRKLKGLSASRTITPESEAVKWLEVLEKYGDGDIYAREATTVSTPIGHFRAYMDEESVLINRHKPPLNRHSNR